MKNYCRFHHGRQRMYTESPDPRDDCDYCRRAKDAKRSLLITRGHVFGEWCKDHNQCSYCCRIKFLIRVLKHYGGTCSPKKCPVCEWARHPMQEHNVKFYGSKESRRRIVKELYILMLGTEKVRKGYWWPYF